MRKLSPQRRRASILASTGAILATSPVLIFNHVQGRGHDFIFGICLGLAAPLLVASLILIKRDRSVCKMGAV